MISSFENNCIYRDAIKEFGLCIERLWLVGRRFTELRIIRHVYQQLKRNKANEAIPHKYSHSVFLLCSMAIIHVFTANSGFVKILGNVKSLSYKK